MPAFFVDTNGVALPVAGQPGSVTIGVRGDVNCDGLRNVVDGLFVLQYDVGLRGGGNTCPPAAGALFAPACDVNSDASCNVLDGLFHPAM